MATTVTKTKETLILIETIPIRRATQFDQKGVLKVEDAGLYTCLASSLAGEDGKNHWIRVQGEFFLNCEETFHPSSGSLGT